MAAVMIGVGPHKGSHTAVAIDQKEEPLGQVRVRASGCQAGRLVARAAEWPERTWAVEGARGLGSVLARQLVAGGERVLDVQPRLGARVRLLAAGDTNKNDPSDARSAAVAALRSTAQREVRPDDHAAVLKVWSKRHRDLGSARSFGVDLSAAVGPPVSPRCRSSLGCAGTAPRGCSSKTGSPGRHLRTRATGWPARCTCR